MDISTTPYNAEIEQALLGSLLIAPEQYDLLDISSADFYVHRHVWIFEAIGSLRRENVEIDVLTLGDRLAQMGKLQDVGGPAYLTSLIAVSPSSLHVEDYAHSLRRFSMRRKIIEQAGELAAFACKDDLTETELIDGVEVCLSKLAAAQVSRCETVPIAVMMDDILNRVAEAKTNPSRVWGIPTGYVDVDSFLGGFQPGEMVLITGEPGIGKSRLALNFALGMADSAQGAHSGAIFSLEMTNQSVGYRAVSAYAKVDTRSLHSGNLNNVEYDLFCSAAARLCKFPIYMNDRPQTLSSLRANLTRLKYQSGIEWFVLDYLMLMNGFDSLRDVNERTTKLSQGVKMICKELDLTGIVLNSVTKEGFDKENPSMADMRGPSSVAHDGDIIIFVVSVKDNSGLLRLIFEKTREVGTGGKKAKIDLLQATNYPAIESATRYTVSLEEFAP